jgi:hypothetical protein
VVYQNFNMKYIKEKAPSVKSKVKQINQKIGKLVSKKEDAVNKAKEMADSEEPSGKMQASLAKIQLRQSESEAEKLMLQKQAEILKAKIDTAKKKEKTVADLEEMENKTIKLQEGVMSNIHLMADASKDWEDFLKKFKKDYKKVFQNTPDFMDWLYGMYKDMAPEKVEEANAKPGPDPYMRGLDDDEEEDKEDKMKKQAEMDDDDPDAYKELPGDKEAKEKGEVKTSKHVKKYHELYGDKKDESIVSVIIEDFSQRKRNFTAELKGRMELAKNGETMKVGDLSWTKVKNNWKGGKYNRTEPHQLLVPFIADMLKKDIKSAATYNAEEVQDMVVFESVVNEEKAEGDRGKIADANIEKALKTKSEETGVPIGLIRIVMRRGMAAWKTGHRPGATEQQWGYARVNAFLTKGEGTWGGADKDVAKEVRDGGHDKGLKERIESDIRLSDKVVAFKTDDSGFEGQSPNTITCNNCTWTWQKQDGGDDMYVCHKCGTNNEPILGEKESVNEEDTYNDYPAAAKKNAKKALDWRDEYGRDEVDAGTAVGWTRANQLAKGEKISADTVKRMASFNRHRKNSSIKPELKATPWKDKGYVSWLIWGGDEGVDWAMKKSKEIDDMKNESKQMKYIKPLTEAEKYITDGFKVGDKIKTNFGEWEVIETDYAPGKSFMAPFIFKGKDMERVNIPNPPKTNKNAIGYKVTDGDKYPIIGFLYQYKDITKLATVGVDESVVNEKLTRGLKPLLTIGSTITKKAGEDALLDLSDKFDRIDDEYAGTIASWLDMAIELMQDGYAGDATKKLKQFNKKCKDVLNGKDIGSAFESVAEGIYAKKSKIVPGEYIKTQYGYFYKRVEGTVGGQDAYVEIKNGKEGKRKTSIHDTVDFEIVDKSIALSESVNEAKTISFAKASMLGSKLLNKIKIGTILDTKGGQYEVTGFGQQSNAFKEFEATLDGKEVKVKLTAMYGLKLEVTDDVRSARFNKEEEINSIILESLVNEAKIKVTKNEWPYLEFKVGGKLHKVDFDYEDIIDDHGNEGQDQYWIGKDDEGQEWMIDVYADYRGEVEEVHYDTIVKESVSSEFSPMGYAKRVVSGAIKIKDAMKEAGISLANMAKLIKRIDKSFDVDAAFLEKNVMQDDPEKFNESVPLKYIKPLNEGYWSSYEYDKWVKDNGRPKYPKWIKSTLREIVKGGFMDPVYDSEHQYMVLWLASLDNKKRSEAYAYDKKGEKELGKVGYAMYQRFYNDLTGYNMFFMQGALAALEVSKNIQDRVANGEPVEPAYYMMKEYFNNMGMDTKRSRVFNAAYEKLEKWMKDNSIPTL